MPVMIFIGLLSLLGLLVSEITLRKGRGLHPASWREALRMALGKSASGAAAETRQKTFVFVLVCFLFFPFWERFLSNLFQVEAPAAASIVGLLLLAALFCLRMRDLRSPAGVWTREQLIVFSASWVLLTWSVLALCMAPWLVWRGWHFESRPLFKPKRQISGA